MKLPFPAWKPTLLSCLLALPATGLAQQVIVSVGEQDITDTQLNEVLKSTPTALELPTLEPTRQATARGDVLMRLMASAILAQEAQRLGLDKSPEFRQEMTRFRNSLLYRRYLEKLRNSIPVPTTVEKRIHEQFPGNPKAQEAARSIYVGKRFPEVKLEKLQALKKRYHVKIYPEKLRQPGPKDGMLLAEGDGIRITWEDIDGASSPNLTESMLRLQRAVEGAVFARAAEDENIDIAEPLADYRKQLLSRLLLERKRHEWMPTEAQAQEYYHQHPEIGRRPTRWHAGEIVLGSRDEAENILGAIRNGASLFNLAEQYSIDPASRQHSGDLGWLVEGTLEPEHERALKTLEVGGTSDIIPHGKEFHILTLIDKRPGSRLPFNAVKDRVVGAMLNERLTKYLNELQKRYPIRWKVPTEGAAEQPYRFNMQ